MASGAGAALRVWCVSELRRRWASLVVLGLLAGVASGLAIAAFDGGARSGTAYTRMRSGRAAADAVFYPSQALVSDADVTKLGTLDEVVGWAGFSLSNSSIDELEPGATPFILVGDGWFDTIERAVVVDGRLPDPNADDEAVINEAAAREGVGVGSQFTWRNLSAEQGRALPYDVPPDFDWKTAEGPVTTIHVVGVLRTPVEFVASFASGPQLMVGPGWAKKHFDDAAIYFTNALVRLKNGSADVPVLQQHVAELYGRDDLPVKDLGTDIKRVQRSVEVERTALILFGAAVLAAAVVLVGQGLVRSVRAGGSATPVLRAMGLGRPAVYAGLLAPHLVSIVVASAVALITATIASARFPIGLARRVDPDVGVHVPASVVLAALFATALVLLVATMIVVALTTRAFERPRVFRRHVVISAATRAGLPIPPAVGTSLALEQAPSQRASVRPALLAAIVGVVAVVGSTTLVVGIDDALREPARVGAVWDLEATPTTEEDTNTLLALAPTDDIAGVTAVSRFPSVVSGIDAPLYALLDGSGQPVRFVMLRGRAPKADGEVALGARTASVLDAGIGDTVKIGLDQRPLRVVGVCLLMQTPHSSFDEGAWVTPAVIDAESGTTFMFRDGAALIRLQRGADRDSVMSSLNEKYPTSTPSAVPDVENLGTVRRLPLYLAAFLVMLAIGAVAHALITGARHRAHELAVLRALGITPRQAAACVSWQATVIGVIALAIGIPAGVILGRSVWRLTADSLSFVYIGPIAPGALLLTIPGALFVCWLLAVWPARAAGRRPAAEVLRSE
jgi:ABC-type lipoprotein release transport system permease subunit